MFGHSYMLCKFYSIRSKNYRRNIFDRLLDEVFQPDTHNFWIERYKLVHSCMFHSSIFVKLHPKSHLPCKKRTEDSLLNKADHLDMYISTELYRTSFLKDNKRISSAYNHNDNWAHM